MDNVNVVSASFEGAYLEDEREDAVAGGRRTAGPTGCRWDEPDILMTSRLLLV